MFIFPCFQNEPVLKHFIFCHSGSSFQEYCSCFKKWFKPIICFCFLIIYNIFLFQIPLVLHIFSYLSRFPIISDNSYEYWSHLPLNFAYSLKREYLKHILLFLHVCKQPFCISKLPISQKVKSAIMLNLCHTILV